MGLLMPYSLISVFLGLLGLLSAYAVYLKVKSSSEGEGRVKEIGDEIHLGAMVFMSAEYKRLAIFCLVCILALYFSLGWQTAASFLLGALCSGIAGFIGMYSATKANVRTAVAAKEKGAAEALNIAFFGGSIMGLTVAAMGLFGIGILFYYFAGNTETIHAIEGFAMGASSVALFSRVGGGIFTKSADVGADLVGKVEAGIPEDDPRNPAVIADNVGDNVGDCAGMAADLFETYAVTIVATMVLSSIFFPNDYNLMVYPLAIGGSCIITSIIGTWFVKLGKSKNIMGALYKGFIVTAVTSLLVLYPITDSIIGLSDIYQNNDKNFSGLDLYLCGVIGFLITGLLIWITEYYTGTNYRPVQSVAKSSTTGHGTNVIQGLAVSMEATALPALIIVAGILYTNSLAGLYGIAIAVTAMLALTGMVVALDAYGPVTDNAGGIAEMSKLPKNVRKTTDALDAVGNTTKAVTKGYAIGSAGLGALVLFAAYTEDIKYFSTVKNSALEGVNVTFDLSNPFVVAGLLIGGMLPYLFGSMGMQAVGRAGGAVVIEVRRQFKKIPGIMKGKRKPDYGRLVDLLTKAAIKEMIIPSLLPVLSPIVLYFVIFQIGGLEAALSSLGAMLLGVIITGLFVAVSMTAGGGAWDNAKKYIEDGNFGGKGSEAHKSAVTGDTVGDPYKDTAGPAINPMIKITNIVALLLLAVIAH
mgnify:CR=1 FL=1